jgi:hypothetical protein
MANMFNIQFIPITRVILEAYKFQIWSRFFIKFKYAIRYKGNPVYNLNMNSKVQINLLSQEDMNSGNKIKLL